MAFPIGQGILSFAIHLPEFVGFATLEALRCRAVALRADPFVTFQNAVDGSHRQRRGFFVAQQYLQFFRTPPGLLTQSHHALLLPRFRAAKTPMRPSTTLGQLRQTAALLVSPLPQISRRARNPEFAAEHRESLLLALRSNHKLHALLAHIHLVPRHGFQPPRPETLTAGVKHVLATTVKDVLAPYTKDPPLLAGLKPGLYNGKNNGRSNGLRDREPNARVARTAWDMRRQCDAPIRRGNGEIRDTTFWQGGADYRRRYWDRASDRAGVCAGRREPGRGRTTVGKASRGDQRSPEAGRRGIGDGVRRDAREGGRPRCERNGGAIRAAECAGEQCGNTACLDGGGDQRVRVGPGDDGQCEGPISDVAGGAGGGSKGWRRSHREYWLSARAGGGERSRGVLCVERRGDDADEGHGHRSCT